MIIYTSSGTAKAESKIFTLSEKFMETAILSVTVSSPTNIDFTLGDYVTHPYSGRKYFFKEIQNTKKVASSASYGEAFQYILNFKEETYKLEEGLFLDLVSAPSTLVYTSLPNISIYARPVDIANRIQANMDYHFGVGSWSIVVASAEGDSDVQDLLDTYKDVTLNNVSCMDALNEIYKQWNLAWIFSSHLPRRPSLAVRFSLFRRSSFDSF